MLRWPSRNGSTWFCPGPSNTNFDPTGNAEMRKQDGSFAREGFVLETQLDKVGAKGWELRQLPAPSKPCLLLQETQVAIAFGAGGLPAEHPLDALQNKVQPAVSRLSQRLNLVLHTFTLPRSLVASMPFRSASLKARFGICPHFAVSRTVLLYQLADKDIGGPGPLKAFCTGVRDGRHPAEGGCLKPTSVFNPEDITMKDVAQSRSSPSI